eukprot:c7132_g1_i2.p1 GENE.c7132_g1_i2~~c7132_g1_i2.p1  ORF type:complete len:192 (-),score=56.32 c7132_g1_i2:37-585(-)
MSSWPTGFAPRCPELPPRKPSQPREVVFCVDNNTWTDSSQDKSDVDNVKDVVKKTVGWEGKKDPFWDGEERYDVAVMPGGSKKLTQALVAQDKKQLVDTIQKYGDNALKEQVRALELKEREAEAERKRMEEEVLEMERQLQRIQNSKKDREKELELVKDSKPVRQVKIMGVMTDVMEHEEKR